MAFDTSLCSIHNFRKFVVKSTCDTTSRQAILWNEIYKNSLNNSLSFLRPSL